MSRDFFLLTKSSGIPWLQANGKIGSVPVFEGPFPWRTILYKNRTALLRDLTKGVKLVSSQKT